MALTDPTSGAGYAFGERLTSADMTTLATQQPYGLDTRLGNLELSSAGGAQSYLFYRLPSPIFTDPTEWGAAASAWMLDSFAITNVATQTFAAWHIPLPPGTLTKVRVFVTGGTGRAGLPATAPQLALYVGKVGASDVTLSNTSSYGNLAEYEAQWNFFTGTLSESVPSNGRLIGYFVSEYGANAQAGFELNHVEITMTMANLAPVW
jgi:hypothetical protein